MNRKKRKIIIKTLAIMLGNTLDAAGFTLFVSNSGLITGGTAGLGLFINRLTGIPVSAFVLCFNIAMLVVGLIFLGKSFALSTVVSSVFYPFIMGLLERFRGDMVITSDPFLCTVMGGILIGAGAGLVLRSGASSGGMDVPPLLINKYLRIPLSTLINIFDVLILLMLAVQTPGDGVLYGIVMVIIYSMVIDKFMLIGKSMVQVQIITDDPDTIKDAVMKELDRGVTLMKSRTGYLERETEVVMTVVSSRQLVKVERIVHDVDSKAFMIVTRASEVMGEGFSLRLRE